MSAVDPLLDFDLLRPTERVPSSGRRLRVVEEPSRRRRPKLVYGIVALAGALAIGTAQMALSIMTTQSSYELSALTQEARQLTWQKQILADDVAGLSSPSTSPPMHRRSAW